MHRKGDLMDVAVEARFAQETRTRTFTMKLSANS